MTIYSTLLRPLLFRLDPEAAHHLAIAAGAHLGWAGPAMRMATRVDDARLATEVAGLHFPTPIGLAAGFDKSGTAIPALAGLGFGAIEIGSVSVDASAGNPKPRLWRIPADQAILAHYGLPNDGVENVASGSPRSAWRCRSASISSSATAGLARRRCTPIRSSANISPRRGGWLRTRAT